MHWCTGMTFLHVGLHAFHKLEFYSLSFTPFSVLSLHLSLSLPCHTHPSLTYNITHSLPLPPPSYFCLSPPPSLPPPPPFLSIVFEEPEDPSTRSFFSEIIASISDVKFSHSGRYILSRDYLTVKVYSGTSLIRTPLGQKKLSLLVRCPDFRGCNVDKQGVWDSQMCPVYRGVLISGVS